MFVVTNLSQKFKLQLTQDLLITEEPTDDITAWSRHGHTTTVFVVYVSHQ